MVFEYGGDLYEKEMAGQKVFIEKYLRNHVRIWLLAALNIVGECLARRAKRLLG